jgi:hypothetical protein
MSEKEFIAIIHSPFCEKVEEYPKTGDLIAINYNNDMRSQHAAIYIGGGLVFQKSGSGPLDHWEFADVFKTVLSCDSRRLRGTFEENIQLFSVYKIKSIESVMNDFYKNVDNLEDLPVTELEKVKQVIEVIEMIQKHDERPSFKLSPPAIAHS